MSEFDSLQEARKEASSQVHDVELDQTLQYLEEDAEYDISEDLSKAERVLLVETPDITETGVEFRFYESSKSDEPYTILELEDSEDYEVLLE
jgi:hypothetical protein